MSGSEFEQAVLLSFNQNVETQYRSAALASLTQLKHAPEGWRFCLEGLVKTQHSEVKFWCLQALCELVMQGRYATFGPDDAAQMQHTVFSWLERTPATEQAFIKNKLAQLLVLMLETDYPERWASFFPRLLAFLSQGETAIDLYLRILNTLHEEVLSPESGSRTPERLPIATRIKDAMRAQTIGPIVESWYAIVVRTARTGEHVAHCRQTLQVLRLYVPWIEVSLVANESLLPLLLGFSRHEQLHEAACGVLAELVVKGMEPAPKLAHLAMLNLAPTLSALVEGGVGARAAEDGDGQGGLADSDQLRAGQMGETQGQAQGESPGISFALSTLICALAEQLLECWEKLPAAEAAGVDAGERLRELLPLALCVLESPDLQTSHTAAPFLHAYLGRLRRANLSPQQLEPHKPALQRMLLALARRLCYRDDYDFEEPDEPEELFQTYRKDLATLLKAVARVEREGALAFTFDLLQRTAERPPSEVPFAHAEVVLLLLYHLGEGLPEAAFRMEDSAFARMLVTVCGSQLSAHPHRCVKLLFFELLVRYSRFFQLHPAFVPSALEPMCDARGLHAQDAEVRGRVCYLLLRLVKTLHAQPQQPGAQGGGGGGGGRGAAEGAAAAAQGRAGSARAMLERYTERLLVAIEPLLRAEPLPDEPAQPQPATPQQRGQGGAPGRGQLAGGEGADAEPAAERGSADGACAHWRGAKAGGSGAQQQQQQQQLRVLASEQLHLYECAGVLLGGGLASAEVAARLLLLLLAPLSERLGRLHAAQQQRLTSRRAALGSAQGAPEPPPASEAEAEAEAEAAAASAHVVGALGTLSKGFTHATALGVAPVFASSLEAALRTAAVFPQSSEIRSRLLMLLHRMVECLGEAVLDFLLQAAPQLLAHAQAAELHELVSLLNQVVIRFKAASLEQMTALTPAVTRRLLEATGLPLPRAQPPEQPLSEAERERVVLLRLLHSFVHALAHNGLVPVLVAPSNLAGLDTLLALLLDGCVQAPDAQMQRQCVAVLQKLTESWACPSPGTGGDGQRTGQVPGFDAYALSHIAPALLRATLQPWLSPKDAGTLQLFEAVAGAQQAMHAVLGARYSSVLLESVLPALGCSPELASTFAQHVASGVAGQRPTAFRDFLRSFVENYHASQQQLRAAHTR